MGHWASDEADEATARSAHRTAFSRREDFISVAPTLTCQVMDLHAGRYNDGVMTDTSATELIHTQMPLCATLGITADTFRPDEVVLSLDWSPSLCTGNNVLHGGIVMALADSAGGACAFLNLPEGAGGTATIESKTNFLAAIRSGAVKAHSHPLHIGTRTIVVETDVRRDDGKLVAKVLQTQAIL
jgi:1,4-dihydroxy-2-naphthoyl-CoA hydrolase